MTLLYLSVAFGLGILTGYFLRSEVHFGCSLPAWILPTLLAGLLALALLFRRRPQVVLLAAIAVFFVLGAWRYAASPFARCWTERDLAFHQTEDGVWATVEGEVVGFPDVRDKGVHYQVDVERVVLDGQEHRVSGRAMVEAQRYPIHAYGDTVRISGLLLIPPTADDFDYRRYLAIRNIHTLIRQPKIEEIASGNGRAFWRILYGLRDRGAAVINRIMPEPAAALTNGMVLGIEGGIPDEVHDAFKATGTSHLIVISGSNVALLAGALMVLLGKVLSRRRAALAAAPLVLLYVLLVGADPPALRAGVMGLLALGAMFFGRRGTAYVSLFAAALVMAAVNPLVLWDIGFRLSFMTSLGLILFTRPLNRALLAALRSWLPLSTARRWAAILDGTLIVTVAAQIAVLPLILAHFGRLSPVSLVTNCLVLPVQPAILSGGIAALLAGASWQPLGQAIAAAPWLLLSYTAGVVRGTAALPFASLEAGRAGPAFVVGYYLLVAAVLALPRIAPVVRSHPQLRRTTAWAGLFVIPACLFFFVWRTQPDGRLHVVFVPGDGAEAAVVVAPTGRTAWIWDGRGDGEALVEAARGGRWVRGNPDVVLADCEENPWPAVSCVSPRDLAPGSAIALTDEVRLTRLPASGAPALLLTYRELRVMLPATLMPQAQEGTEGQAPVTLLKAPGPGTGAWPSVHYLRALQPQLVLWPLETTYPPDVARYLTTEVAAARVEADATVEVLSDGEHLWLTRHSAASPR